MGAPATIIETDIPARLDRLAWSGFHNLVVAALGITWILDGLEVTLAGSIAGALEQSPVLQFSATEVGALGSAYLVGAVLGALLFGYLTDRFGRRRLFFGPLSQRHRGHRAVVEFRELCAVSGADRGRHRRRVRSDQFGNPGIGPGPLSRPHRSRHQWQFLARRGSWRAGRGGVSQAGPAAGGCRLARRLCDRRHSRPRRAAAASPSPGKPALADPAQPPAGGRADPVRHRAPGRRRARCRGAGTPRPFA